MDFGSPRLTKSLAESMTPPSALPAFRAKLPKILTPNYRKNPRQITEKFNAKLPKTKLFDYLCRGKRFIYGEL